MTTQSLIVIPQTTQPAMAAKTPSDYPDQGLLVEEFDIWQERYAGKTVIVYRAGTTELIKLYSDIGLTQEIANPQVLLSRTDPDGTTYGKFNTSVYSPYPYTWEVDGEEQSGIHLLPITDLAGKDGSNMLAPAGNATRLRKLKDRFGEVINVRDYGELGEAPATNTATIAAAISAASLQGGGKVIIPAGTFAINQLTLPGDVILVGQGRDVTILQSEVSDKVITITGDAAGLRDIMLDGVLLNFGSTGIYGKSRKEISLDNVEVKRFSTGIHWQGGENHQYRNLFVRNCTDNVRCLGDADVTGAGGGSRFTGLDWFGGQVSESTGVGIEFSVNDLEVNHNAIEQIDFENNIGASGAILVYGARFTKINNCFFEGNINHIVIQDSPDESLSYREVVGLQVYGGDFGEGTIKFDGLCQDIIYDQVEFDGVTFELNVPVNQIMLRDCFENETLFTGQATRISRFSTTNDGVIKGTTTNATATDAFKIKLLPNEVVQVHVSATAEQTNGGGAAAFESSFSWENAPATLNYDDQTVNFTVGEQIVGATSGATAIIAADSDSGAFGQLSLSNIVGEFVDDEIISELNSTGSARTNGTLVHGVVSALGAVTAHRSVGNNAGNPPTGWALGFTQRGEEGVVQVTGAASADVFWALRIRVTRL